MAKTKKHSCTEISCDVEWVKSTLTEEDLNAMVIEGIIPDRETSEWRPAIGELFLTPHTHEIVVFEAYFVPGFGLPAHPFLRNLFRYYGISLCHLNPNSILHISIFINLCEAFLGITPHFNLFRHFFCLKRFSGKGSPKVVGGVYLQLRDGMANQYIDVPLNTSLKGWTARWFYVRNWEPSILADINHYAVPNANWSARPSGEMSQVKELTKILKKIKLDGVGVAVTFVCCRIQQQGEGQPRV